MPHCSASNGDMHRCGSLSWAPSCFRTVSSAAAVDVPWRARVSAYDFKLLPESTDVTRVKMLTRKTFSHKHITAAQPLQRVHQSAGCSRTRPARKTSKTLSRRATKAWFAGRHHDHEWECQCQSPGPVATVSKDDRVGKADNINANRTHTPRHITPTWGVSLARRPRVRRPCEAASICAILHG